MELLCINDKNRPSEIPIDKWVVAGQKYNLLRVVEIKPILGFEDTGSVGYELVEITLDESNHPYLYFDSSRFGIDIDMFERFLEIIDEEDPLEELELTEKETSKLA
jgi:hypothetical protein